MRTEQTEEDVTRFIGAVLIALIAWVLASEAVRNAPIANAWDFHVYYDAAVRLKTGAPLYGNGLGYIYMPSFAFVLIPITHFSFEHAARIWTFVSITSSLAAVAAYSRARKWTLKDAAVIAVCCITLFRNDFSLYIFGAGQADLLAVFITVVIIYAYTIERELLFVAAVLVGFAVKPWLLAWIVLVLLKKAWKQTLLCLGGAAAMSAVMFTVVGWRQAPEMLRQMAAANNVPGLADYSQDITTFARDHFWRSEIVMPWIHSEAAYHFIVVLGLAVAITAVSVIATRESAGDMDRRRLEACLLLLIIVMLLPGSRMYYPVYAIPALWELLTLKRKVGVQVTWVRYAAAAAYLVFTRHCVEWPPAHHYSPGLGAMRLHAPLLVMCCLAWLIHRELRRARSTEFEPDYANAKP